MNLYEETHGKFRRIICHACHTILKASKIVDCLTVEPCRVCEKEE